MRLGIEGTVLNLSEIAGQAGQSVRINAGKVGVSDNLGNGIGIFCGIVCAQKYALYQIKLLFMAYFHVFISFKGLILLYYTPLSAKSATTIIFCRKKCFYGRQIMLSGI